MHICIACILISLLHFFSLSFRSGIMSQVRKWLKCLMTTKERAKWVHQYSHTKKWSKPQLLFQRLYLELNTVFRLSPLESPLNNPFGFQVQLFSIPSRTLSAEGTTWNQKCSTWKTQGFFNGLSHWDTQRTLLELFVLKVLVLNCCSHRSTHAIGLARIISWQLAANQICWESLTGGLWRLVYWYFRYSIK